MSVVGILDGVTAWVRDTICPQIKLKAPPYGDEEPTDAGYHYETVHPAAFPLFVPNKDKLPPGIHTPIPSICVRIMEGEDDLTSNSGQIRLQFCFSTWSPGAHGKDILLPKAGDPMQWTPMSKEDAVQFFQRNGDGWRDAWNMVDIALRELESAAVIGGYAIDRNSPIKYGPLTEQEAIPDYYPFWFAWLSVAIAYPIIRNHSGHDML